MNYVRLIAAATDGYFWDLSTGGEVQPFEEPEHYAEGLVNKRFTPDMLAKYLLAHGIDAFNDNFYVAEGKGTILVEKVGTIARVARVSDRKAWQSDPITECLRRYC